MVQVGFLIMAAVGTLMAIVSLILLKREKGNNISLSYYASMIVGETLVLPMASANLLRESSKENIFAFVVIVAIIIVTAIYLALSKSDE